MPLRGIRISTQAAALSGGLVLVMAGAGHIHVQRLKSQSAQNFGR